MSGGIAEKDMKLLFAKSGNICAFPQCRCSLIEPGTVEDNPAVVGDMAHIVGESRQGPRGDAPMSDEERNKYSNLILLCKTHHKIVDDQKHTYSIPVLRQMKADHEAWV